MLEPGNTCTVFVVCVDNTKDISDAKRYGKLRGVFSHMRKPYNTNGVVRHARSVLKEWQPGDFLLFMGDPILCAVALSVVAEYDESINVLQWDRLLFQYVPETWWFGSANKADVPS